MPYIGNQAVVGDSANTFKTLDGIASFTVTFDATDSGVVSIANNTLTFNNHRFVTGQKVTYNDGGGTAIGGLSDGSYFIIKEDQSTIKLASSASNATSGTAIDLTSGAAGSSHTLNIAQDGVNTKFKATHSSGTKAKISRPAQISLSINGVIQQPTADYTIESDSTIVFSSAPEATDKIFASFIGEVAASFDLTDNTVDEFTGNGSTTTFTLSKTVTSSNDLLVTLDGVTQYPTTQSNTRAYSVLENVLTFTSAPAAGVIIQARHIGFAGASSSAVTGFYGRTGNVQLKNTDNVAVNDITVAGDGTVTGGLTVGGNLDVTGDITYDETVARNLNITGVATVASGIVSTGDFKIGTATTLSQDNIFTTGIITATSFVGSGANLTGVASTENIRTNTNAAFLANVSVVGTSTVTGNIVPSSDSATDIGTNSVRFQNAYVDNYYGSGANLTGLDFATTADINNLINNVAMLGFKVAANGSLAKFDLVDQVVDEYNSSAGIDASASTNETLTSGYYVGQQAGGSASGGTETTYGVYKVHTFLSSGTFTVPSGYTATVDALIVAGGGGGGHGRNGGGGGAGGMLALTSQTLTAGAKTVTVGAGGAGGDGSGSYDGTAMNWGTGSQGGNSSITGLTVAIGGGGGANNGRHNTGDAGSGGSGGGRGSYGSTSNGSGTSGQGNSGGGHGGSNGAAGGGGAGEAGGTDGTRHGGDGATNDFRTGSAVTYAGGGSGGEDSCRSDVAGGDGGGGEGKGCSGTGGDATANTGGGGGGAGESGSTSDGGDGGSGIVVIRYNASTGLQGPADLTLQSTDSTALSAPSTADLVMLIEDGVGTATLNTDVKAFISRDSGANFTEGTLVEEGTWGATTKRIVAFHNLDISSQPSGTSICYKITTHNQGGSKETRIHATSYGWK